MIKNEREYKITKASLKKLQDSVLHIRKLLKEGTTDSAKLKLQEAANKSILNDLKDQLIEYENLKTGRFQAMALEVIESVPDNLIRARISLGWTQKELATKLGTTEQQIQKYEATHYASASFKKIVEIASILRAARAQSLKRRNA